MQKSYKLLSESITWTCYYRGEGDHSRVTLEDEAGNTVVWSWNDQVGGTLGGSNSKDLEMKHVGSAKDFAKGIAEILKLQGHEVHHKHEYK